MVFSLGKLMIHQRILWLPDVWVKPYCVLLGFPRPRWDMIAPFWNKPMCQRHVRLYKCIESTQNGKMLHAHDQLWISGADQTLNTQGPAVLTLNPFPSSSYIVAYDHPS